MTSRAKLTPAYLSTAIFIVSCGGSTSSDGKTENAGSGASAGSASVGGSTSASDGRAGGDSGGTGPSLSGGAPTGGSLSTGGALWGSGGDEAGGDGGAPPSPGERPCDIYEKAGTPCVAAYSPIRTLSADYSGPLIQVRSGSNAQNLGTGGHTHDIGATETGFADADAIDAVCSDTICTVSLIYDQSGRGNHLALAQEPPSNPTPNENFETVIQRQDESDLLEVGRNRVYSLYMEARQGYALAERGDGVPLGSEAQGIYLLADGTHTGTACCWEFGNAQIAAGPGASASLMLGSAYWGFGEGAGPWFLADFNLGVWAGGTNPGDPGWGALEEEPMENPSNPSMAVSFALGFLATSADAWSLRMADVGASVPLTTAWEGGLPLAVDSPGTIVLGVGAGNANNSWGTFLEGALVAGFPSTEAELAVLENIRAAGYGAND